MQKCELSTNSLGSFVVYSVKSLSFLFCNITVSLCHTAVKISVFPKYLKLATDFLLINLSKDKLAWSIGRASLSAKQTASLTGQRKLFWVVYFVQPNSNQCKCNMVMKL